MVVGTTSASCEVNGVASGGVTAAGGGAITGGGAVRCASSRTSSSKVFCRSLVAFLNSASPLPSDRPNSGSLRGPKMISAMMKMTMRTKSARQHRYRHSNSLPTTFVAFSRRWKI